MFPSNGTRPRLRVGLSKHRPLNNHGSIAHKTVSESSRRPLQSIQSSVSPSEKAIQHKEIGKVYFSVLYTKRSKKKNKTWLDGYIILTNDRFVQLQNEDGKTISSRQFAKGLGGLKNGNTLEISSWELEVQDEVCEEDYISGRLFAPPARINGALSVRKQKPFRPLQIRSDKIKGSADKLPLPLYDPKAEGAIILLPSIMKDQISTVPVVLDPFLQKRMRPHQVEGVQFLFDCSVGQVIRNGEGGEGAILADEMGLGKSLQAIALIWTLVKQGPHGKPLAKKAIIVCPASLVRNWMNEIRKWLGDERLKALSLESGASTYDSQAALTAYINGDLRKVLVISYESFRSNADQLYKAKCGLMICDEGHRLKSSGGNKTIDALRKLPCRRRVILTGTPVQNDLEEFFAVCDFVNPGCFGSLTSFRNVFANPIIASRDSRAVSNIRELGIARAKELSRITSRFVIRRTSRLLEEYLPPKHETAIFCRLQPKQEQQYEQEARQRYADIMGIDGTAAALCAINYLRKICSHPVLTSEIDDDHERNYVQYHTKPGPEILQSESIKIEESVKLQVTEALCEACLARQDRIVIVSNFTTVLNLVGEMLRRKNISFCRLDGSTAVNQRGDIVRQFNNGTLGNVFLLSAKAGGVGLNLIGANRLILFDPDWNPATDVQAMARIWRDGQTKPVFVYRLLCTGTIEEKIYQRQLFKHELQKAVDSDAKINKTFQSEFNGNFTAEELRGIFDYKGAVEYCDTLDVLERSTGSTEKLGLFQQFKQYRNLIREEKVTHAVLCEADDALNVALNGNINTHGMVSYLYTKTCGTLGTDEVPKTALPEKRKWSLVIQSETDEPEATAPSAVKQKSRKGRARSLAAEEFGLCEITNTDSDTKDHQLTWEDALKHLDDEGNI